MGQGHSSALGDCLNSVCNGRTSCVAYPDNPLYQIAWVNRYNLDIPVKPVAVTRPNTAEDVAGFIKCAASNNVQVQAKSGGHSYANFGKHRTACRGMSLPLPLARSSVKSTD